MLQYDVKERKETKKKKKEKKKRKKNSRVLHLLYITVHPGVKCGMYHHMVLFLHLQYYHLLKESSLG